MTPTPVDLLLDSDLAALSADNRRDLLPFARALQSAGVYRDERPGAEARRHARVEARNQELALMPLALSQVFSRRVARAASGAAMLAIVTAVLWVGSDSLLHVSHAGLIFFDALTPALNVVTIGLFALMTIPGVYVVSHLIAERAFERRMRGGIATGSSVDDDLDPLARSPGDTARELVRRADQWAVGLGLAGVTALVALLAGVAFIETVPGRYLFWWSRIAIPTNTSIAWILGPITVALALAVVFAFIVARGCGREHARGELSRWVRWLGQRVAIPIGLALGLASLYGGVRAVNSAAHDGSRAWKTVVQQDPSLRVEQRGAVRTITAGYWSFALNEVPSVELQVAVATSGTAGAFVLAAWLILWRRRREQARLA